MVRAIVTPFSIVLPMDSIGRFDEHWSSSVRRYLQWVLPIESANSSGARSKRPRALHAIFRVVGVKCVRLSSIE